MKAALFAILWASALLAQPALGPNGLNAGWLWPKGVYTLVIDDGPGPKTEDIAALQNHGPASNGRSIPCAMQRLLPIAARLAGSMAAVQDDRGPVSSRLRRLQG
jgi:hypothetical protein